MVLLSVIQVSSSVTALRDFMVILFSSPPKRREMFFLSPFFFREVYYADDLSVKYRAIKVELF